MNVGNSPPSGWDDAVPGPWLLTGFATAMTVMGYHPLYLRQGARSALALVRGDLPVLGRLTARATLLAPEGDAAFVREAIGALGRLGIPLVKVGNTMSGVHSVEREAWPAARTTVTERHTFVLDLDEPEDALMKRQQVSVRTSIRKGEREGLKVREITAPSEMQAYYDLTRTTSARVRRIAAYTDFPSRFFQELYARLTPSGAARFYLASLNDTPLACGAFLCSRDDMLYFAGGSTRERAWTHLQAPTAVLWHAVREAKRLGLRRFDFGGCTPTDDPGDPRHGVYAFKKRWGGRLERFYNLEVVLSPRAVYFQDHVLSPLWDRLHPWYFKLRALGETPA
jgi:hypothetical protein